MTAPSELVRVHKELIETAETYGPSHPEWTQLHLDAARILREMAADFYEYAEHRGECGVGGMVGGKPTLCDCGLNAAREKWRLPG